MTPSGMEPVSCGTRGQDIEIRLSVRYFAPVIHSQITVMRKSVHVYSVCLTLTSIVLLVEGGGGREKRR